MGIPMSGIEQASAWKGGGMLNKGWHTVTIDAAEEGQSRNGHPQVEIDYSSNDGSIKEWLVFTEGTLGKARALLEAVGIEPKNDENFPTAQLVGKKLSIFVGEEPDYKDPRKMRLRVQGYDEPGKSSAESGAGPVDGTGLADDDIPF
jgi:hypothetical protein